MADLTIGEIGKTLQVTLVAVDQSVSPPTQVPIDLAGATVTLFFAITDQNAKPKTPVSRAMTIVSVLSGIVKYIFVSGDLVKPLEMSKFGVFRYSIEIVYPSGKTLFTNSDGQLTIKDDATL